MLKARPHLRPRRSTPALPLALLLLLLPAALRAAAPEPLPIRIDRLIESTFPGPVTAPASDADFLRRVYLDFTGTIPTAAEARAFFADPSPDKRAKTISALLASRAFARHLSSVFDLWLMERRPDKHVKSPEWQQFLFDSFATNKPYHQLVRELLTTDGTDDKQRPAARFLLDREAEPNLLTRDIGRVFFGMDLSCAQCHDHPRIDDYAQRDYQGLYAFLNRTYLFTDEKAKKSFVAEKADGDVSFTSVFTKESGTTGPRLPGGVSITEPILAGGEEYLVKPDPKDKTIRGVPKFNRRLQLAHFATDGTNRAFNRNIANRLWKHLMGRGLVDPVDELHSGNPPTSPALLDLLADEFVALKYDLRAFLHALALTKTYQRTIDLPPVLTSPDKPAASRITELDDEVKRLATSATQSAEAHKQALAALTPAIKARDIIVAELAKTNAAIAEVKKAGDAAAQAQADLEKSLAIKRDALQSLLTAVTNAQTAIAKLAPETNLVAAVDQFKARAVKLTNEIDTATKDLPAKAAALKTAREKLAAIELTAKPVLARLADADTRQRKLETELVAANTRLQTDRTAQSHAEKRLSLVKLFADYETQSAALTAARATVSQTQTKLATIQTVLARHAELTAAQLALEATAAPRQASNPPPATPAPSSTTKTNTPTAPPTTAPPTTPAPPTPAETRLATARAAFARAAFARAAFARVAADLAASSRQDLTNLQAQLKTAETHAATTKTRLDEAHSKLSAAYTTAFAVGAFVALTPEQLAWSLMKSTGLTLTQQAAAEAEFDKKNPPTEANKSDPARLLARAQHVEQFVFDKLKGNVGQFATLFGNSAGEPQDIFYASADQALFFNNAALLRSWLAPSTGSLVERCAKLTDPKALADELYLSTLTRLPADDELAAIKKFLAARPKETTAVIQEFAWGLLTSVEFRFKH